MTYRPFDLTNKVALVTERITNLGQIGVVLRLCCTTPDGIDADFISDYYAIRTVLGVPIWENRLRIAARTLRSVI